MRKRRYVLDDKRPKWNDPNLPVTFQTVVYDELSGVTWEEVSATCEYRLTNSVEVCNDMLDWRNDPTYNLRRTK